MAKVKEVDEKEKSNDMMIMKNQTPLLKRDKAYTLLTNLIKERET